MDTAVIVDKENVTKDNSVTEAANSKVEKSHSLPATVIIVCFVLAILSGGVSGFLFARHFSRSQQFVVINAALLLEAQKNRVLSKYTSKTMTPEVQMEINKETSSFLNSLSKAIEEVAPDKIVFFSDAVFARNDNRVKDITNDVAKKLNLQDIIVPAGK